MILCFGTFAKALSCCRHGLTENEFVARIVWVIDRKNSCLGESLDYEITEEFLDDREDIGNPSVVSKLLSCKQALTLRSNKLPSTEIACETFKDKVIPFIDPDKIMKSVLAVLYIISKDDTIDTVNMEKFKSCFGLYKDELLRQRKFYVPDFFARVLLYATYVKNKNDLSGVEEITDEFVENAAKICWVETKWNHEGLIVEILPKEERILLDNIIMLNKMSYSLMKDEQPLDVDIGLIGVNEKDFFPSFFRDIEFKCDRRLVSEKLIKYVKLVREFFECLTANQQKGWPVYPNEQLQDKLHKIDGLNNEIQELVIYH